MRKKLIQKKIEKCFTDFRPQKYKSNKNQTPIEVEVYTLYLM